MSECVEKVLDVAFVTLKVSPGSDPVNFVARRYLARYRAFHLSHAVHYPSHLKQLYRHPQQPGGHLIPPEPAQSGITVRPGSGAAEKSSITGAGSSQAERKPA